MTKCAQLVNEQADVDFIDINVGCPIELIYQQVWNSGRHSVAYYTLCAFCLKPLYLNQLETFFLTTVYQWKQNL